MNRILRQLSLILTVSLLINLNLSITYARWATYEDSPCEYTLLNLDIVVNDDGSHEEIVESKIKILMEEGRKKSIQTLVFNEEIGHIEILEAKTIYQGKEYPVQREMIETKPLASSTNGFDQNVQIMIPFPQVVIGSEIHLKYKNVVKKPMLDKNFFREFYWVGMEYTRHGQINIRSKLPFHLRINDPYKNLTVKEGKKDKFQTLSIQLKKPILEVLLNEPGGSQIEKEQWTRVSISTCNDSDQLLKQFAPSYEEALKAPLPDQFKKIKEEAAKLTNEVDQINKVTSSLQASLNYLGDWKTIRGRFSPRPLKKISESGVGDCKDFSIATVAILRALGYQAQVALVWRGHNYLPAKNELPSIYLQNHAIVKVTNKDGKIYWIDPTNITSFASGIYPDIANRTAYVLDTKTPSQEKIPEIRPEDSKMEAEFNIYPKGKDTLIKKGIVKFTGVKALTPVTASLYNSDQSFKDWFFNFISSDKDISDKTISSHFPPLRIVKDVEIEFSYTQENALVPTTKGPAILIQRNWPYVFLNIPEDQEGYLYVGNPTKLKYKLLIHNQNYMDVKPLELNLDFPWLKVKRQCAIKDNGVEVIEEVEFLQRYISSADMKSAQFKELKKALKRHFTQYAFILSDSKEAA